MDRQARSAAWAMLGAIIGAGFASGREMASFFSRYQEWSHAGITAAVVVSAWLILRVMRWNRSKTRAARWMRCLWRILFTALLTVTGGAMLAASGELAALVLPIHGAQPIGMTVTLAGSILLALRQIRGLAWISRLLTWSLTGVMLSGLLLEPTGAVVVEVPASLRTLPEILVRGVCYGGLNMALAVPVMMEVSGSLSAVQQRRTAVMTCGLLAALLVVGNAVLLRHPALLGESLPFLQLTRPWGLRGYGLSAACLYLAMLTTLAACLRGVLLMMRSRWSLLLPTLTAAAGFSGAVDVLYPLLGGACVLMLFVLRGKPE